MRQKKRGKTQCVFPYCLLGFDGARGGVRGKTSEAQSILSFDGAPAAVEEEKDAKGGLILSARGGVRGKTSEAQSILGFDGAPAAAEEEKDAKGGLILGTSGGVRGKNHTQCGLILAPATAEEESQA